MRPALFKYLRSQHVDGALNGRFRIGTLYEYRNEEAHGGQIGDADEGTRRAKFSPSRPLRISRNEATREARFFQAALRDAMPQSITVAVGSPPVTFLAKESSQDLYVFSCSFAYSPAVMQQFGYDACIQILDPRSFFAEISLALTARASYIGHAAVQYDTRERSYRDPHLVHLALLKDPRYAYQAEVRALWRPSADGEIEPVIIDAPKAGAFATVGPDRQYRASVDRGSIL